MPAEWNWFDIEVELLDGPQKAFIAALRSHASAWSWCRPIDTCALVDEDDPRELTLIMDVLGASTAVIEATLGVVFFGESMRCGETHTQNYALLGTQRVDGLDARGFPQELAAMAAGWLERTAPLLR